MHGIIIFELKKFVNEKFGAEAWQSILENAGQANKIFVLTETYPDEDVIKIVVSASKAANMDMQQVLHDFGYFIAADLLKVYKSLVNPSWKTIDLLENTESI